MVCGLFALVFERPVACVAGVKRGGRRESEISCAKCEWSAERDRWVIVGVPT